jgi:hypothetical protein
MIVKEAKKINLPIMGMVNSHCNVEIDYPIFAQDQTLQSVHFFCCFLATLIAKEHVYFQHKRYILQQSLLKSPKNLKPGSSTYSNFFLKRLIKFQNKVIRVSQYRFYNDKALFFRALKPMRKKKMIQKKFFKELYFSPSHVNKKNDSKKSFRERFFFSLTRKHKMILKKKFKKWYFYFLLVKNSHREEYVQKHTPPHLLFMKLLY